MGGFIFFERNLGINLGTFKKVCILKYNKLFMVKISHEVPHCLLEKSLTFNDYQYCLPHLLEQSEQYKNHFIKCSKERIPIYLDNSVHELGTPLNEKDLLECLERLGPEVFFIPDKIGDFNYTVINAKRWAPRITRYDTIFCPVIQGKNIGELKEALQRYQDFGYNLFALPYNLPLDSYFKDFKINDFIKCLNRIRILEELQTQLYYNQKFHLLGTFCPYEFTQYVKHPHLLNVIKSIDTSNPVMMGIEKRLYNRNFTNSKPSVNLNKTVNIQVSNDIIDNYILPNLESFKNIFK